MQLLDWVTSCFWVFVDNKWIHSVVLYIHVSKWCAIRSLSCIFTHVTMMFAFKSTHSPNANTTQTYKTVWLMTYVSEWCPFITAKALTFRSSLLTNGSFMLDVKYSYAYRQSLLSIYCLHFVHILVHFLETLRMCTQTDQKKAKTEMTELWFKLDGCLSCCFYSHCMWLLRSSHEMMKMIERRQRHWIFAPLTPQHHQHHHLLLMWRTFLLLAH